MLISERMMEMAKENVEASIKVMVKFLEDKRLPEAIAKYYSTLYKELHACMSRCIEICARILFRLSEAKELIAFL